MSTATITDTARSEAKAAANAPFESPLRRIGQMVTYFTTGQRHGRKMFGFVSRCGDRFTDIQLTDGSIITAVAHIDDPKLKNAFIRDKGAWEHTEDEIYRRRERHAMLRRLRALEFCVIHHGEASRDVLIEHCKELEITGYSTLKNSDIRDLIKRRYDELFGTVESELDEEQVLREEDETTDVSEVLPPPADSNLFNGTEVNDG